ncbi:DUF7620 family protein [Sphaerisporangium sp. NPDC004334]
MQVEPSPEALRRIEEARRAREEAEQRLAEVCDRWPEVHEVVAKSRRHLERNGFAEMFRRAVRGTGDPSAG